ncbi:Thioesterase family protein [Sphingomonas antarctica]|uniref:thioesterase family protein n=1 Tax=Sphingomonas antarctica TaxID=2040274 RepID=UPI0039ED5FC2
MSLPEILAAATFDGATMRAEIAEGWLQGRTAYGGLSAAIALAAAKAGLPDLPPLRSAQIAFVGPLAGVVTATPTLLRRGKNSAFVGVDVVGESGVGLRALFLFMAPRESAIAHDDLPAPAIPLPDAPMDSERLPQGFLRNFDVMPWDRGKGTIRAWRRLRERAGLDPEIELMAIADALPPAAMSLIDGWGPISTTTWQFNVIEAAAGDGWFLLEAVANHAAHGASVQAMNLWNHEGRAVATATQSVALFI